MKPILLLFFLFQLFSLNAENLYVMHIKGVIFNNTKKVSLKQGDNISETDEIKFQSGDAMAAVMSPSKGRFTLKPNQVQKTSQSEFIGLVKSNIVPSYKHANTRATLNTLPDLQGFFCEKPILVSGNTEITILPTVFEINEKAFFYLTFQYKNEKINKKIPFKDQNIILNQNEIQKIDGVNVALSSDIEYTLNYFKENKVTEIGKVKLVFVDQNEVKSQFDKFFKEAYAKDKDKTLSDFVSFLNEFYGKTDLEIVKTWVLN